ncbi:thiol reductant ABC exporter subunit CydD [Kushneria phosphatilytica]|uniref:Thiol reductant ABC exporter subunit CydD n=1 Tax=Kushneria phosphatilytica TaxID=657387 RepID=A0A1S1NYM7_9GAMM|nr:thiol reductant ABC exporter subunit CydD [Kushneria phosphatilytica]OHV12852.1 thiol reductant ABC exporter subunit CydD [Kushneria phosphatilytica]QEL10706.1 thiol reductant ABC exporter subunit CydD [Kushneria phosphatilytica]
MAQLPTVRQWLRTTSRRAGPWQRLSVLAGTLSTLLLLVQAWSIATVAQRMVLDHAPLSTLLLPLCLLPLAFAGRGALAWLKTWAGARAGIAIRQSVRRDLLERLARLGPLWAQRQHSATLGNRIWDQVDALQNYHADFRPQTMLCATVPLIILAVVFPLNWAAGIILMVTGPLIPLNMIMVGFGARGRQEAQFLEMGRMSRHFLDTLRGLPTLKLFGVSRRHADNVFEASENFRQRTMRVLRLAFLSSTALEFFSSVSIAILALYIGFSYLGQFHFGTWGHGIDLFIGLFLLILAPEFYQPLRDLGVHYHAKAEAEAAAEDLIPILERPIAEQQAFESWEVPESLSLRLQQVTGRYAGQRSPALSNLDMTIKAGERVAVIGPSGAGKSTLLNVLMGFMRLEEGALLAQGDDGQEIDIARLAPEQWQRSIAWVGQRPVILSGTLADNLRLANIEASDEQLHEALAQADLSDWVKRLPDGLETLLGDRGQPVSGGQARRIALARAFLRDAPLLLLDEPTASLDRDSEARVLAALKRLCQGRTVIMLTHRLALLQLSDRVLMLDQGRAVAIDTFEALRAPGGPLANNTSREAAHVRAFS